MKIIAIGHKARQGKDTLADFLRISLIKKGYTVKKRSFADALYEECRHLVIIAHDKKEKGDIPSFVFTTPWGEDIIEAKELWGTPFISWWRESKHRSKSYEGMTDKDPFILQWWGSFRREQDSYYWTQKVLDGIRTDVTDFTIIPDCRYKNEAEWVKSLKGEVWRVVRTVNMPDGSFQLISLDRDRCHPSETDLDRYDFDRTILAGALRPLEERGEEALQELLNAPSHVENKSTSS